MKSELLAKSPLLALPLGALFLFLLVFGAVVFLTMRRKAAAYDRIATLPLEHCETERSPARPEANEANES